MAELVALQPNITIKLHIVAPGEKRDKVLRETIRPVFSWLVGHAKLESTVRYLGLEVDDALEMAEQTEI
jgi:hypothetical protein